jgi:bacterioferritin
MACAGPILFGNVDMFYTEFIQPYRISEEIMSGLSKEERRARVIDVLNQARAMELFAITQYMNQHYGLDSMDYGELAAKMKLIAIDEMRHAEMFAERVKDLGGEPTTSYEGDLQKGQDVHGIYPYDTKLEDDTIDVYSQLLLTCRDNGDSISAKLFETIIEEEQAHMNYFDNVGNHIETLGDTYLSKIAGTSASTGPSTKGFLISGGN